jgi:hypothetical protein
LIFLRAPADNNFGEPTPEHGEMNLRGRMVVFRTVVVTCLVVAQAAGFLPCCCTMSRLAATPSRRAAGVAEQPDSNLPACCHHKTRAPQPEPTPQDGPGKSLPGRPGCPCRQDGSGNAAVALAPEAAKQLQQRQLSLEPVAALFSLPPACPMPAAARSQALGGAHALPFLTADDILRAFHILRC